ncbi:unnamed protein product [Pleuronectes platessa]|uniref:Uncharacterized protein n=1 Tax=Pleuronectes platessa TaxID=8262 RepID=A0A9N7Z8W0_PLEPL|nr:unnamed protein product [Pleuronectes platessa]
MCDGWQQRANASLQLACSVSPLAAVAAPAAAVAAPAVPRPPLPLAGSFREQPSPRLLLEVLLLQSLPLLWWRGGGSGGSGSLRSSGESAPPARLCRARLRRRRLPGERVERVSSRYRGGANASQGDGAGPSLHGAGEMMVGGGPRPCSETMTYFRVVIPFDAL